MMTVQKIIFFPSTSVTMDQFTWTVLEVNSHLIGWPELLFLEWGGWPIAEPPD
jgi:hypothetical protein